MKTAEQTPLSGLSMAALVKEAGFPDGVVNILSGEGDAGAYLARHPGIDKVSFTGSTEVGYDIMRNSHVSNLKRITLELGGKSPNVITKNANFEKAVGQTLFALFMNAGQSCMAGSRAYVHSSIYDRFVEACAKGASQIKLGHSLDPTTQQGPLISEVQMNKVLNYIEQGKKAAKQVTGTGRWGDKGFHVTPTIFADVKEDISIAKEQIFGPVLCIMKYDDNEEVIDRANNTNYGLAAGVVT